MKKNLLLSILLLTIYSLCPGQNFAVPGTQWYYNFQADGGAPLQSEYIHFQSVWDTLITGKMTHKITRTYYRYTGVTESLTPFYVYEKQDTAFMYNFQKGRFLSLYIFNKQQGDTLKLDAPHPYNAPSTDTTYRLIINTVEIIIVDGVPLKKYKCTNLDQFRFYYVNANGAITNGTPSFMDRIGGLDWFLPRSGFFLEMGGPLRCYLDDQIDTTFFPVACDHRIVGPTNSVAELDNKLSAFVYPNPSDQTINIRADGDIDRIELSGLTGEKLLTTKETKLDISEFKDAMFILTIYFKSGDRIDKKLVKNTR